METNEEENVVELRKIPLAGFIDMLQELYDNGADYVDIIAKPNQQQDVISLIVREEYIDPACNNFVNEEEGPLLIQNPLSLNSINLNELM